MSPLVYQPLDRSKNEIRVLKILPPRLPTNNTSLEHSLEPIECRIEHVSLDDFTENSTRRTVSDEELNTQFATMILENHPDILASAARFNVDPIKHFSFNPASETIHIGPEIDKFFELWRRDVVTKAGIALKTLDRSTNHSLGAARVEAMRSRFSEWQNEIEQLLGPDFNLLGCNGYPSFKDWTKSWIWSPLSGDSRYPQASSTGYLALSYAWNPELIPYQQRDDEARRLSRLFIAGGLDMMTALKDGAYEELKHIDGAEAWLKSQDPTLSPNQVAIFVDGVEVLVNENLANALQTMREIPEVRAGMGVWVDGVCVNQTDSNELSLEVKRMGDIYRKASHVISFLGKDPDEFAFEALNALGSSIEFSYETGSNFDVLLRSFKESEALYRIAKLVFNPYWTRTWITQEIAFSNLDSVTIWGSRCFKTANLLKAGSRSRFAFVKLQREMAFGAVIRNPDISNSRVITLKSVLEGFEQFQGLEFLQKYQKFTRHSEYEWGTIWFQIPSMKEATDPRDLVYGMASLFPKDMMDLIRVDYSPDWSFQLIMTEFAAAYIKTRRSLDWILFRPWTPFVGATKWPSWVPTLTGGDITKKYRRFSTSISEMEEKSEEEMIEYAKVAQREFNSLMELFNPEFDILAGTLTCTGCLIDVIQQSSTNRERAVFERRAHSSAKSYFDQLPERPLVASVLPMASTHHQYGNEDGLKSAISECFNRIGLHVAKGRFTDISLLGLRKAGLDDITGDWSSPVFPTREKGVITLMEITADLVYLFGCLNLWGKQLNELFAATPGPSGDPRIVRDEIGIGAGVARMFTTCKGFVGMAISHVRAGDRIFILPGCKMPVVLHPSDKKEKTWELVGGVFIPGLMGEDAVAHIENNGVKMERLTIV
jgi:hypothetical protein